MQIPYTSLCVDGIKRKILWGMGGLMKQKRKGACEHSLFSSLLSHVRIVTFKPPFHSSWLSGLCLINSFGFVKLWILFMGLMSCWVIMCSCFHVILYYRMSIELEIRSHKHIHMHKGIWKMLGVRSFRALLALSFTVFLLSLVHTNNMGNSYPTSD